MEQLDLKEVGIVVWFGKMPLPKINVCKKVLRVGNSLVGCVVKKIWGHKQHN